MSYRMTVPPVEEPVLDEDMKAWGRKRAGEENIIAELATAARELIESWIDRSLITRTYEQYAYGFPAGPIELETPGPWQAVVTDGFTYVDEAGDTQTLTAADFQLDPDCGLILPAYGTSWPVARNQPRAVTIAHTCGYGDTPEDVPELARQAMRGAIQDWIENRRLIYELPAGVKQMLWSLWSGRL